MLLGLCASAHDSHSTLNAILQVESSSAAVAARAAKWRRPTAPALDPKKDSLQFMQVELDNIVGDNHPALQPNAPKPTPIIRMFGVTAEGYSVNCNVWGFEPYFWVRELGDAKSSLGDAKCLAG